MILSELLSTIIQLIAFGIIPFLWWIFTVRKTKSFHAWLGLTAPKAENTGKLVITLIMTCALLLAPGLYLILSFEDKSILATAKFAQTGFPGFVAGLCYAFIKTGFAEEVLFRGFLCKRLSNKFGFSIGNTAQSIMFGLLHGILLFELLLLPELIAVLIFTTIAGWLMGYLNEKLAGGSIIPSWIVHGVVNLVSVSLFLFGIVDP